jgi:hypothetical protein
MNIIREHDHVLIADTSGNRRIYKLEGADSAKNKVVHYKNFIDLSQFIGLPYNSWFQIADTSNKSGKCIQIESQEALVKDFFLPIGDLEEGPSDEEEEMNGNGSPSKA